MAQVKLFGNLRDYVPAAQITVAGGTVRDILGDLCSEHLELEQHIFNGESLLPHVRVMVNGRDIDMTQGLDTPLEAADNLSIFPPIAGG